MKVESLLLSKAARRTRRSSRRLSMKIKSFRNSSSGHCYHVQCTKNVLKLTIILHGLNYQSAQANAEGAAPRSPHTLLVHSQSYRRPALVSIPTPRVSKESTRRKHVTAEYVILNLFQDLFQAWFQGHIGLMDSGSAAGMTKRVCIFLLTSYFLLLTSRSCHPELVSGSVPGLVS
jgi:hypothetical protein